MNTIPKIKVCLKLNISNSNLEDRKRVDGRVELCRLGFCDGASVVDEVGRGKWAQGRA